jgi:hypothetical protein
MAEGLSGAQEPTDEVSGVWLRDRQRLLAHLRAGLHIAEGLGLEAVGARASEAIAALDGGGYGRRP